MNSVWCLLSLLFIVTASTIAAPTRYDNEPLIQFNITTQNQLELLQSTQNKNADLFDVWSHGSVLVMGAPNQVHVSNIQLATQILSSLNITFTTLIPNIQHLIDTQNDLNTSVPRADNLTWFTQYHTYESIIYELNRLCASAPSLCIIYPIGSSIQGRTIYTVHLSGELEGSPYKVWLSGGQHAREWVSPATVMYLTYKLISSYGVDPTITSYLNTFEFIITVVINPDGYDFSWTNTRLWRKNRRNNGNNIYGVDLNRNWNNHWAESGSSNNPRDDTYHGTGPFSEPETKAVSQHFLLNKGFVLAIDYHAYSQLILRPYHWGKATPPTENDLNKFGKGLASAIKGTHGLVYDNIPGWELYVASGGADDWFYQQGNAKLAYTIELRDTGRYGFVLPASQIVPTGQENWNALVWGLADIFATIPRNK